MSCDTTEYPLDALGDCYLNGENCSDKAEKAGLEYVGDGAGRVTWRIPESECVVKFARDWTGEGQNVVAGQMWEHATPEQRELFAEVYQVDDDEAWLTQEYVPDSDVDTLEDELDERGVKCTDAMDENIGADSNGNVKIRDLGGCTLEQHDTGVIVL